MSIADIKKMPLEERIYLMEQIWDTLKNQSEDLDSPTWHEDVLKDRKDTYMHDEVESFTIEEIRQKLK